MDDAKFLKLAIAKAKDSVAQGGFPAGAVVVRDGRVVGEGISLGNKLNDPTSHGDIAAIRDACKNLGTTDLSDCTLYLSIQSCLMCFGATMSSGIKRVVYAATKEKILNEYYGGHYQLGTINSELTHPIGMVHLPEFEEESLALIHAWEQSL
jgi:tRNA(Arg) A34 adenosine deaminase TadA